MQVYVSARTDVARQGAEPRGHDAVAFQAQPRDVRGSDDFVTDRRSTWRMVIVLVEPFML